MVKCEQGAAANDQTAFLRSVVDGSWRVERRQHRPMRAGEEPVHGPRRPSASSSGSGGVFSIHLRRDASSRPWLLPPATVDEDVHHRILVPIIHTFLVAPIPYLHHDRLPLAELQPTAATFHCSPHPCSVALFVPPLVTAPQLPAKR